MENPERFAKSVAQHEPISVKIEEDRAHVGFETKRRWAAEPCLEDEKKITTTIKREATKRRRSVKHEKTNRRQKVKKEARKPRTSKKRKTKKRWRSGRKVVPQKKQSKHKNPKIRRKVNFTCSSCGPFEVSHSGKIKSLSQVRHNCGDEGWVTFTEGKIHKRTGNLIFSGTLTKKAMNKKFQRIKNHAIPKIASRNKTMKIKVEPKKKRAKRTSAKIIKLNLKTLNESAMGMVCKNMENLISFRKNQREVLEKIFFDGQPQGVPRRKRKEAEFVVPCNSCKTMCILRVDIDKKLGWQCIDCSLEALKKGFEYQVL